MEAKRKIQDYVDKGELQKAIEIMDSLLIEEIEDTKLLWLFYETYFAKSYMAKAMESIKRLSQISQMDEQIARITYDLGLTIGDREACKIAVDYLSENEIDPYKVKKLQSKYYKRFDSSNEEYINLLEELADLMYDEESVYDLALNYYKSGDTKKSKRLCRKLIRYFPQGDITNANNLLELIENPKLVTREPSTRPNNVRENNVKEDRGKNVARLPREIEKEFEKFVGMEEVKQHIASFANQIQLDKQRNELLQIESGKSAYNFMLTGNPGTGKTTVARTLAKTLHLLGITESDHFIEVDKSDLVGEYIGATEKNTRNIIADAMGGVLFIDEAYTLYNKDDPKDFGRQALEVIMKSMEDYRGKITIILAGYEKEMKELLNANPGIESRINIKINIPDYSDEELLEIADKIAEEKGFIIVEEARDAIIQCIHKERIDEKFGNARFIRELINTAHRNLASRLAADNRGNYSLEDMMQLRAVDFIQEESKDSNQIIRESLEELNSLTGLKQVKDTVNSKVNQLMVEQEMQARGISLGSNRKQSMHMIFKGNPGTGKTTVARIMGNIYKALGILKRGDVFIEVTRADLVGQYQGHTASQVKEVVAKSLGGILFIDEAYALSQGENDSFGKEAIDTLIAEMENNRDKLLVILAGYNDEMDELLASNPGFKSRINTEIIFEDYTADEMLEILKAMINKDGLYMEDGGYKKAKDLIEEKSQDPYFGNARGVRNIYESILANQMNRIATALQNNIDLDEKDFKTIRKEDI